MAELEAALDHFRTAPRDAGTVELVVRRPAVDEREMRALAGDQLYLDLDLSRDNLPAGTRLSLGTAVIEVTPRPRAGTSALRHECPFNGPVTGMRMPRPHRG